VIFLLYPNFLVWLLSYIYDCQILGKLIVISFLVQSFPSLNTLQVFLLHYNVGGSIAVKSGDMS